VYCIGKTINRYLELQLKQMDSDIQCGLYSFAKILLEATLAAIDTTGCNDGPFLPEGSSTNNHSILERFGEN